MNTMAAKVLGPLEGRAGFLGSICVRFLIDGADAHERFALVEHPMSPRFGGAHASSHARG